MAELNAEVYSGLKSFLEEEGMQFGIIPEYSDLELVRRIGKKRFSAFCRTMDDYRAGRRPLHDAYLQFRTVEDANALMSAQAEASLACHIGVIEASGILALERGSVGELGCYSGSVLRFVARQRPALQFTGFDRLPQLLKNAKELAPANCDFEAWDYQSGPWIGGAPFDALFGVFCIDFEMHEQPRDEGDYISLETAGVLASCTKAFANWREMISQKGRCTVALRLGSVHAFSGACQAAWRAGWEVDFIRSCVVKGGDEQFPIISMTPGEPREPDLRLLEEVTRGWERIHTRVIQPPGIAYSSPSRPRRGRQKKHSHN